MFLLSLLLGILLCSKLHLGTYYSLRMKNIYIGNKPTYWNLCLPTFKISSKPKRMSIFYICLKLDIRYSLMYMQVEPFLNLVKKSRSFTFGVSGVNLNLNSHLHFRLTFKRNISMSPPPTPPKVITYLSIMNRQISIYGTPGQLKYDIKMGHLIILELLDNKKGCLGDVFGLVAI